MTNDKLTSLLFNSASCRGQMVNLDKAWQKITSNHDYPEPVLQLLGELVAASVLLSASLKFEGSLILQLKGDGPIVLLVAECSNELGIRATIKLNENLPIPANANLQDLLNQHGQGVFAVILDPKDRQPGKMPYQGIVSLTGNTISDSLESYMKTSEQLETRLCLYANKQRAAGLMLQQMPKDGGIQTHTLDPDAWERLLALSNTINRDEILSIPMEDMTHRLFWEEKPELLPERTPHFECTCSRHKVARMLFRLGRKEIDEALAEQSQISVHCDFCNSTYLFTPAQCDHLFTEEELEETLAENDDDPIKDIRADGSAPTIH